MLGCLMSLMQSMRSSLFEGKPMDFLVYSKDIRTKRAVERNIEIIGEAVGRIYSTRQTSQLKMQGTSWERGTGSYTATTALRTI